MDREERAFRRGTLRRIRLRSRHPLAPSVVMQPPPRGRLSPPVVPVARALMKDDMRRLGTRGGRAGSRATGREPVHVIFGEDEVHVFAVAAGTVLFLESSACVHCGSRRPAKPRYQLQYSLVSPLRNDFLELWHPQRVYPLAAGDDPLRRLVLDRAPPRRADA
jgi:hypothetical protein